MSGKVQTTSQIPQNPLDTNELHALGYTVYASDIALGYHFVDTALINNRLFFCETRGGIHYFVSNTVINNTTLLNSPGCEKLMTVNASAKTANGRTFYDVFPYEYRPPLLGADSLILQVPPGYYISNAAVRNQVYFQGGNVLTDTVNFIPAATTNQVIIPYSSLPPLQKLLQTNNPAGGQTFYAGDQDNTRILEFRLLPLNCNNGLVNHQYDSVAVIKFNNQPVSGIPNAGCNLDSSLARKVSSTNQLQYIGINPNLQISAISNTLVTANSDTVCWRGIKLENANIGSNITAADNVFIAIPTLPNYISNWHFINTTNNTTITTSTEILNITHTLAAGTGITGDLCARVITCPAVNDTVRFNINYGWHCGSYPQTPYGSNVICQDSVKQLSFTRAPVSFGTFNKDYKYPYTLCDTLFVRAKFSSMADGYVYPYQVQLHHLNPALQIAGAFLYNDSDTVCLTPTVNDTIWIINADSIRALNSPEHKSGIHGGQFFWVHFNLIPTCAFLGSNTLPNIQVLANTFCNDSVEATSPFTNNPAFAWNGHSDCSDCFTLTKTANTDTIAIGDTVTFTINVCSHNAAADTMYLTDLLPSSSVFTLYSATPPMPAYNTNFAADTCVNYIVKGTYKTTGNCPSAALQNKAVLTSGASVYKDSVCVNVYSPCVNAQVRWLNGTYAKDPIYTSSLPYTNKSIYVEGLFYIDTVVTLNHCTVYTKAGAQIIVTATGNLTITNGTIIQGCDSMWHGILANSNAKLMVNNASIIKDANRGIEAKANSTVIVDSSSIVDCVTGIYTGYPNNISMYQNINLSVTGSKFALLAPAFKPDYTGQPAHGAYPKAGMDVRNLIFTLGSATGKLNTFTKMGNGIIAQNCQLNVRRSSFSNIAPDGAYTEAYNGTAIVCQRDVAGDVPMATLTIIPDGTFNTVYNCFRGVYTKRAVITANYVHLLSVRTGMRCEAAPLGSKNMVNNCTITASNNGLYFIANPLAFSFVANYNKITINGVNPPGSQISPVRYGIYMSESSQPNVLYTAIGDTINLNNATYGIYTGNLKKPLLKFNQINFTGAVKGISLNHIYYASVSCNTITGSSATTGIGVLAGNSTTNSTLYCNSVNQSRYGFYFGGACPQTVFKGNEMNSHLNGLYLNNSNTYMGQQPNFGNKWNGPFGGGFGFGAVNNAPAIYWLSSLFKVDPSLGLVYNPIASPANGWFQNDTTSNTYYCQNSLICSTPIPVPTDTMLYDRIANGTFSTDEAQAIAEEYLYEQLKQNNELWINDSLYIAFMAERSREATGYLYDAKLYLRAAGSYDSAYAALIDSATMQLRSKVDSITYLKDLKPLLPNHEALINALYYSIDFLNQTINNLNEVRAASIANDLANASLKNDYAVPAELPEQNEKYMNEIDIAVASGNNDIILQNYATIFSIAQQCPYTGGPAVEQARHNIATVNDSVFYDDDNACLLQGVYRMAQKDSVIHQINNSIIIKPNPANNKIEIILQGINEGVCNIIIENSLGQKVIIIQMDCKEQNKTLDISKLLQGVYTVKVNVNGIKSLAQKLIIAR